MFESDRVYSPFRSGTDAGVIRWLERLLRLYWSGCVGDTCEPVPVPAGSDVVEGVSIDVALPDDAAVAVVFDGAFFVKANLPRGLSFARRTATLPWSSFSA